MGWIVYSKDGQTEKCVLHKLEYSGTFMGDRTVIATFSSEKKIDFSVFDYITYRGERFELELLPTVKKVSSYEYKYELRFVSLKYELERCMMRNIVPGDNGIVYPTPLSVEFTGDVKYLAERIQACLDAMYGKGAWSITIAESTESEEKNISMSNQNCWDALSLVNTEYKLNYFIKGRNVIIGGEEPVVDNVFEYGKGKGLYEIERISDTDTGVVTKLRAYGGTRNLDYSYPKLPDWEDSVLPANYALSPLRLMLPSFKSDGKTDYVLASEEAIAKYGIREGTIIYDDIYPSITGMKNSSGQAIDEIKSVSAITNETQPTFTVGLYDLGFDLNESLTTDEAQMSMKSGSLQGYTFNITKIERASDGSYTLTLGRNTLEKEDTGNFTVPNKDWNMKAGDKFVLLNILMPQAYIRDAENRLLARAKEYLAKYSSTNYSYNVGVDEIFMARNVNFYNDIMEGKRLTVNDQEIGINNENIIIQSLTIKEGEGIIPTFEVTLNNETTASTLDRIQGQISEVETSVSNNFSSQSELLKQYRKKLDKSVWDSIFVIHKDDSENPEKITSVQSLVGLWTNEFLSAKGLNPGSGESSGEGGATALYQLNDVAKNASETGVLGAGPGKILTYGNDGKWYAADAVGLDETALGKYLTDNNYAQKSDIPSLSGYATQSWVLGKNYITSDALSGYATQSWVNSQGYATASSLKAVSDKLNDFLEGSDTDGIINKWKELEAFLAGQTQTSTLADLLAVKADKATTLSGYGITDAYTKTEVNTKLGSYVTTTALNTALAKKVDVAFLAKVFGFIGEDSSEVTINDMGSVITSIKSKFGLWTDEYLSSKGLNPNAGGGSGEGATALYQLNDVSQNASGTGVLGAEAGKVLTYGSDGKWYAAKAGMDEDALSSYLTENNYAQKSDIPSLNGYATQSWVNTALEKKVDKVSGMGLSHNDFTDTLLQKLNGIAEGANKYILPIAKAAVLGGVMIGSTLTASATGVLDLPEVAVAGTYAKVTTDVYGRVTAGSSLSASDIPALGISKITGLQAALDNKVNKADFVTEFDNAMQRWFVRDTANKGLHPADYDSEAVGIYSDSYMSAKGVNTGAGGSAGGASSLGELNNVGSWADDIPTVDRIMVQRKGETHWESLNLSDIGLNETQLSDYLTTNNYAKKSDIPSLSGYATQAWVNTKLADYATTSSVTTLLAEKVDKVEGKGLSANDFTDTLLNKLNGIEAGANKYVLPTASGSVLGGVKVGTTLSIANGVLNLKSGIATAGTYTKVTVDTYGRVVSGDSLVSGDIPTLAISKISGLQTALDDKANKDGSNATGTWGISITGSSRRLYQAPLTNEDLNDYTYANHSGKMYYAGGDNTTVNSPSDAYGLMVWRIAAGYTGQIGFGSNNNLYKRRIDNNGVATGWMRIVDEGNFSTILDTRYVTKTFLARLFGAMDADGNEIAINNTSTVIDSIKAKVGLWTEQYLSSKGLNPNAGSGEGSDYNRLDAWDDYSADKAGYVLSAKLGNDLNTRVKSLEGGSALTVTTTGSGNAVTSVAKSGTAITVTKGTTFVDTTNPQTIGGSKTFSSSILMGRSNLHYVNNSTTTNATGLYWKTANYAATQFGIGCFTTNNASPRGFIGWTSEPWNVANSLTVSETSLTYKGNAILHAANYNTYAPTKTGGGASGSWGINITGNAATATTANRLVNIGGVNWTTLADATGNGIRDYVDTTTEGRWMSYGTVLQISNVNNPDPGVNGHWLTQILSSTSNLLGVRWRTNTGAWSGVQTIVTSGNYTSYVTKVGTATIGAANKGIYLNAGTPTAMSSTVGSTTVPVYMNAGAITVCSTTLGVSITGNAKTATTLQTTRKIFSQPFSGAGDVAGQAMVYGTYQETASSRYSHGGIQVRENGLVGDKQTADGYAPAIGFHWGNRIGASLILTTSGFKFMNQAFTGYQNVYGIFKGNADSATQVYNTETNPTSGTWYNGTFVTSSTNGNKAIRSNDGFKYYTLEGTASAQGEAMLQLGTPTATGTAGNKRGRLVLYSSSSGYGIFVMTTTTGAYTFTFPAATGTVALTSSNVASATKLQTARTLWGQNFNGTANVSGNLTGVGNIISTGDTNIGILRGGSDATAVVLNATAFKPYDAATNKLNLGTSAARWLGLYANIGNFSSTVTGTRFISTVATGTAPLTVSSTTMVTNLNADMVDGIHSSNIPLEYDANYIPSGTAARWLRIAYFDYTGASYSWSGTFAITNTYSNDENKGLIFTVSTAHGTTSPVITQIGGSGGVFTSIRIVKDTTTVYPTTAKVYLEVYYNSTSATNNVYVSYKPANRAIGKWTLYTTYTAGSIPTGHTAIAQLYTTSGLSTTANLRVQGTAVILGSTNHNDRLDIQSDGKIVPHSTSTRRSGVYGVYDAAKIGHIWSMGTTYMIADDGSGFGNLYGFAYQYSASDRATGHQAVWCVNGAPKVALGNNFWVASNATIGGTLTVTGAGSVNTLTIKNTEAVGHLKFSRGSFNYITAPTSGLIAFIVNGQAVGEATADLIIQNGVLKAGATNATALGQDTRRWSNMYSVLLNVSGVATLSSTVNIAGVLNANNATDATSTTAAGAVFDGGVGIVKQLRVGGNVTIAGNVNFANSGQLSVPYTGGQWISMATRTNLIVGKENTSEASAHGLYRVKSFAGDAVVFGGLKNSIGFYGFYKARIDSGDNGSDWATTWNTTTGALTHNKAMTVSGAVTFSSTLTVASTATFSSTTDATSTTAAAVKVTGGLGVAKQLRVGGAVTLSSTLAVTSTSTFTGKTTHNGGIGATTGTFSSTLSAAGVVSFTNATDATSTTAAAVKITGGLGIAKQLRVGGASTFSGTINTSVATFIKLGANATDQKILKDVDGNGFYSGISFFGTKGSNMGVSDIMMNIYAGGAIQIHSQAGSGQILLNGTVHNNVGMYSDGYMSSKGLNDTSDMRLKNKGRDIFLSVKDIARAPAFEYTWKDGTPGVMAGSSAQYWQKVLPPSVKVKKDGYMTMFYGHTALVATISLARHVETLEERVERLERENKEKDKRIKELERRISAWE